MSSYHKQVKSLIENIFNKVKSNSSGKIATYIPELAKANPNLFAISFVDVNGNVFNAGKHNSGVPIESISKVFSLALAVEKFGKREVDRKIGNEGSSLPFNNVVACVLSKTHTINPFVNQGAIATTSLLFDKNKKKFRKTVLTNMDRFAGRKLPINMKVYRSEGSTNSTNMALAYILKSYGRFYGNVENTVDIYTEQCSKVVTSKDLATMAAVFANKGYHPINKKKVISQEAASYVYRALRGEGLYEYSGQWNVDVGCVSAKSGVGGGIFIIIKGVGGIGLVSPPLDNIGNSVRGIKAGRLLSKGIMKIVGNKKQLCNKTLKKYNVKKQKSKKKTRRNI